ncbi:MAG: sel1 repeat family protein [Sulfuritalea sp.]|nr:sel1 repeat family protein [Sulfuritalea sp.]
MDRQVGRGRLHRRHSSVGTRSGVSPRRAGGLRGSRRLVSPGRPWATSSASAGWQNRLLLRGEGIAKDGAQAVALLKPGALRGDPYAQRMLGLAYLWGVDVVKNARFGRNGLRARPTVATRMPATSLVA